MALLKPSKMVKTGVILILLGLASYCVEMVFYNAVNENGVLRESLFLPLTFILGFAGCLLLVFAQIKELFTKNNGE